MDTTMMNEKKWIDKDDFASKGVGNTALGLSIGALGIELLRNGGLGNLLGGLTGGTAPQQDFFSLYRTCLWIGIKITSIYYRHLIVVII